MFGMFNQSDTTSTASSSVSMKSEVKEEDEMSDKQDVEMQKNADGKPKAQDPVQKLVYPNDIDYLNGENDDFVETLRNAQDNISRMSKYLWKTGTDQHKCISEIVDDLKDMAKALGVFPEDDDYFKGLPSIRRLLYHITTNVGQLIRKSDELEIELTECKKEVCDLKKKDERMKYLEEMYKEKVKNDALFVKTDAAQYKEIADLRGVVDEQQKLIEDFRQMQKDYERLKLEAEKSAKVQEIKNLNNERVLSRKELEDLEDSVSQDIKMMHARRLFVQSVQAEKVKPVVDADAEDQQRQVIEKSLSALMENINALQMQVDRIRQDLTNSKTQHVVDQK